MGRPPPPIVASAAFVELLRSDGKAVVSPGWPNLFGLLHCDNFHVLYRGQAVGLVNRVRP
jgi:hypothetical protein